MIDARVVRTREALDRAIIELTAHKAVTDVTVSELAELAGINRVTFYKHFNSPSEALATALQNDLEQARSIELTDDDPLATYTAVVQEVLDHVDRLRAVYTTAISSPHDGVIQDLLADHFTQLFTEYFAARAKSNPDLQHFDPALGARMYAHGLAGAIKSWVLSGTMTPQEFIATAITLSPDWWFPKVDAAL